MQYMKLDAAQREELLAALVDMPMYLRETFSDLSSEQTLATGPDGTPSPVEQVWHLADLEREGFGERIHRLLSESAPHLPDFDGTRIAAERHYRTRSLEEGLLAFAEARENNVSLFRALDSQSWLLSGTQDGVGRVSLCDIPAFMTQHDSAHKNEIEAWKKSVTE